MYLKRSPNRTDPSQSILRVFSPSKKVCQTLKGQKRETKSLIIIHYRLITFIMNPDNDLLFYYVIVKIMLFNDLGYRVYTLFDNKKLKLL